MKKVHLSNTKRYSEHTPSCDWKPSQIREATSDKSKALKDTQRSTLSAQCNRIFRHKGNFKWSGVKTEKYKKQDGGWSAVARNVLIGNKGETCKFHLRYFEIEPGGFSSLEKHRHEHVVICIRGKGRVLINKKIHTINYLDTVYIAPNTVHQLTNPYDEPFGFFCIVNAKRDRPKLL